MDIKLVGYAMGWVENCLQKNLEESDAANKKYAEELYNSYMIIDKATSELMLENQQLKHKLQQIRVTIDS